MEKPEQQGAPQEPTSHICICVGSDVKVQRYETLKRGLLSFIYSSAIATSCCLPCSILVEKPELQESPECMTCRMHAFKKNALDRGVFGSALESAVLPSSSSCTIQRMLEHSQYLQVGSYEKQGMCFVIQ